MILELPTIASGWLCHLESIIRAEFDEMPGMRLTAPQACRLWGLTAEECALALGDLVESGFLIRDREGRFSRSRDHN
jgi:hypothetical protein